MSLKPILLIWVASLSLQTAQAEINLPVQSHPQKSSQSVFLDMQNMTCALCKFTIKKAFQDISGVAEATVDYDTKTAKVTFDPQKTNVDALIKATTDAGYPATIHQENK